jgi:hypothetical protein
MLCNTRVVRRFVPVLLAPCLTIGIATADTVNRSAPVTEVPSIHVDATLVCYGSGYPANTLFYVKNSTNGPLSAGHVIRWYFKGIKNQVPMSPKFTHGQTTLSAALMPGQSVLVAQPGPNVIIRSCIAKTSI